MRRLALIGALTAVLTGCGFYLKGTRPAPAALDSVRVTFDQPYRVGEPPLVMVLQNRLRAGGALVQGDALMHIHISSVSNQQRVLSVSPVDGRVAEYELTSTAIFNVSAKGRRALIQGESLSVQRAFSVDNAERLASGEEQNDVLAAMQGELADLILLRAESALKTQPAAAK